jgi:hypothetical protein
MTNISKDRHLVTFINVITTDPSNQMRLVELLKQATSKYVQNALGFISSSLHRSVDGTKVTMYAQCVRSYISGALPRRFLFSL